MFLRPEFDRNPPVKNENAPNEPTEDEVNLDIRFFVNKAVEKNLKRKAIMVYLCLAAMEPDATDKVQQFFPVAGENNLSRNEILVWMYIASGGSADPKDISKALRIRQRAVEKALVVLDKKNIVIDGRTL